MSALSPVAAITRLPWGKQASLERIAEAPFEGIEVPCRGDAAALQGGKVTPHVPAEAANEIAKLSDGPEIGQVRLLRPIDLKLARSAPLRVPRKPDPEVVNILLQERQSFRHSVKIRLS